MQLTQAGEYAVLGVTYLALNPAKNVLIKDIAKEYNISVSFLAKIFQNLARCNLIISTRGKNGGFKLAKKPKKISVKDVLEAVEGPFNIVSCFESKKCNRQKKCKIKRVWKKAQKSMLEVLEKATVAELI